MRIKTAAKINLALDVAGKRPDGYHDIESVFQTVGIYDEVGVELAENGITVDCILPESFAEADPIPCDERNIAYKAAALFAEETGYRGGCSIRIVKSIPSQAGMGGGSSDAAAVLYCLNSLTGGGLSPEELARLGKRLGADVPFFFSGGTALVGGIGEKISPLPDFSGRTLVIAKGREGVSTGRAYALVDALADPVHPPVRRLAEALSSAPDEAYRFFGNIFDEATRLPEVERIKEEASAAGALAAVMTGSGSAVFALFDYDAKAAACADRLRALGFFAEVCVTVKSAFIEQG